MTILCGTDFSEMSKRTVAAAGHLAARMKVPLHLMHCLDIGPGGAYDAPRDALTSWAEAHLKIQAEKVRAMGVKVQASIEQGPPDEAVLTKARELSAELIIVGALGSRPPGKWSLGSHADKIAQRSHVPVLVIRNPGPFEQWAHQQRPLRVGLGVDFSSSGETAAHWIEHLAKFGPCEIVALHLYWLPGQFHRLGMSGVRSFVDPDPRVMSILEREFSEHFAFLKGHHPITHRFESNLGAVGERIAELAAEENVDVLVVGSKQRSVLSRVRDGSVSRDVLESAKMSVACVPVPLHMQAIAPRRVRKVLVATDFSEIGNAAIPLAYSVIDYGGTVHLVHVVKGAHSPLQPHDIFDPAGSGVKSDVTKSVRERLMSLIPIEAVSRSAATRVWVLESADAAEAITQAAERLGVDGICLGTHGRKGISQALLASVAESVLQNSQRPVFLTRGSQELRT